MISSSVQTQHESGFVCFQIIHPSTSPFYLSWCVYTHVLHKPCECFSIPETCITVAMVYISHDYSREYYIAVHAPCTLHVAEFHSCFQYGIVTLSIVWHGPLTC